MPDEIFERPDGQPGPDAPTAGWLIIDLPKIPEARGMFDVGIDAMMNEFAGSEDPSAFLREWARRLIDDAGVRERVVTAAARLARGREAFQVAAAQGVPPRAIPIVEYVASIAELAKIWEMTEPTPPPAGRTR